MLHLSGLGLQPRPAMQQGTTQDAPWQCALYASGQRPAAARKLLAAELGLPSGALRVRSALHMPGVSVQMVSLPRGLPQHARTEPSEALRSGIFPDSQTRVAVGEVDPQIAAPTNQARSNSSLGSSSSRRRKVEPAKPLSWRCEGHRYTVILRGISPRQVEDGSWEESLQELNESGFTNFFELSSFGLAEVRRYEIGAALWCGQWDKAARLMLTANREPAQDGETTQVTAASAAFASGDLAKGLDLLPEGGGCEGLRALALQLLLRRPALEALQKTVPPAVWGRHLSAVARLAWNRAVAARLSGELPLRPMPGDLVWDSQAGEARQLSLKEVHDPGNSAWRLSDVVMPLPRLGEPVPESPGRLHMEAVLRQLVPGEDAAASDFPLEPTKLLPRTRRIVGLPVDLGWDTVEASAGAVVDCDLSRLLGPGAAGSLQPPANEAGGRRLRRAGLRGAVGQRLAGPALRLRFTLQKIETAEALLRELLRANPSEFQEGCQRQDEVF